MYTSSFTTQNNNNNNNMMGNLNNNINSNMMNNNNNNSITNTSTNSANPNADDAVSFNLTDNVLITMTDTNAGREIEVCMSYFCHAALAGNSQQPFCTEMLHWEEYKAEKQPPNAMNNTNNNNSGDPVEAFLAPFRQSCRSAAFPRPYRDKERSYLSSIIGVDYLFQRDGMHPSFCSEMQHYDDYKEEERKKATPSAAGPTLGGGAFASAGKAAPTLQQQQTLTMRERFYPYEPNLQCFWEGPSKRRTTPRVYFFHGNGIAHQPNPRFCTEMNHWDDVRLQKGEMNGPFMAVMFRR